MAGGVWGGGLCERVRCCVRTESGAAVAQATHLVLVVLPAWLLLSAVHPRARHAGPAGQRQAAERGGELSHPVS